MKLNELTENIENEELWNLDYTIAKFAYPRLIAFNQRFHQDLQAKRIEKMIYAMEYCILFNEGQANQIEDFDLGKVNEGFELFGKHFMELWD